MLSFSLLLCCNGLLVSPSFVQGMDCSRVPLGDISRNVNQICLGLTFFYYISPLSSVGYVNMWREIFPNLCVCNFNEKVFFSVWESIQSVRDLILINLSLLHRQPLNYSLVLLHLCTQRQVSWVKDEETIGNWNTEVPSDALSQNSPPEFRIINP